MPLKTPAKFHDGQFVVMGAPGDIEKSCVICVGSTVSGQIFVTKTDKI